MIFKLIYVELKTSLTYFEVTMILRTENKIIKLILVKPNILLVF